MKIANLLNKFVRRLSSLKIDFEEHFAFQIKQTFDLPVQPSSARTVCVQFDNPSVLSSAVNLPAQNSARAHILWPGIFSNFPRKLENSNLHEWKKEQRERSVIQMSVQVPDRQLSDVHVEISLVQQG